MVSIIGAHHPSSFRFFRETYLVQDKRLVVIKDANLARISELQHVDILNVDDVLYR